jgi:magnesium transporter
VTDVQRVGADAVVGDCGLYTGGERVPGRVPLQDAAHTARRTEGYLWVGLREPTDADIAEVAAQFRLPTLAVEDAVHAHQRPKLEIYDDVVFAVLKPVRYVDHVEVVEVTEIAMFLQPHAVVSVRHGEGGVLRQVRAELDTGVPAEQDFGAAGVLYRTADRVVDAYEVALGHIDLDVDDIERLVFGPGEDDHSERIYKLKQEVAEFRRAMLPLQRPLERLAGGEVPHVPAAAEPYFRDVHDHLLRAVDAIEVIDRQLTDVLQANTARVTTGQSRVALRQNEDMRKISAWAAIALLPTAIAGIYGMNFEHMPELGTRYGYYVVLAVIVGACLTLHRAFRRNRWL